MKILVLGASGMLGRKLSVQMAQQGSVLGRPISKLILVDSAANSSLPELVKADLTDATQVQRFTAERPDVIIHLAAVVSSEAESNFDKGYDVNLRATQVLLEAVRSQPDYRPRVVFASSIAVFGPPLPEVVDDDFRLTPRTSYGTQKAMVEMLVADYSRRGYIDGVSLRMPTICVRPGEANRAASGFFSNILREPLVGREAILPVAETVRHWFASPRAAVGYIAHAMNIDLTPLEHRRSLNMPGVSATVAEQIESLRDIAGSEAVRLIRHRPDTSIASIIEGWVQRVDASRAISLGFAGDVSMKAILMSHVEDELVTTKGPSTK